MEVDMEYLMDIAFGGYSSTSSTTVVGDLGWVDWSPAIDWGNFAVDDDFSGLLEHYGLPCSPAPNDWSTDVSRTSTNCPGSPADDFHPPPAAETVAKSVGNDDKGLRIVHLLMAAAEALSGENKGLDLARVILVRLKELLAHGGGATNMERLAAHFTDALQRLLDGGAGRLDDPPPNSGEVLEAFQMLQDMSPYVKFGHFTANQAILEAVAGARRVHIVDYDIMEGVQWASLMQAMVSQNEGPPPHLRITAVARCGGGRRLGNSVLDTGRRLAAFAASVGLSFSFGQCRMDSDDQLRPAAVKVVKGEAVVLNCALHAPHLPWRSAASVASFLASAGELGARVVTVVEEAVAGGGGDESGGFVGSFMEEMKRYSAIWDSLEAGFPMQGKARVAVERLILGPMIAGSVGRAYRRREDGGEIEGWAEWMEDVGFIRKGLSFFNLCQSRLLLGLFNDGYRVEEEGSNKLAFCWKNCKLLSASVWSSPAMESPATSGVSC